MERVESFPYAAFLGAVRMPDPWKQLATDLPRMILTRDGAVVTSVAQLRDLPDDYAALCTQATLAEPFMAVQAASAPEGLLLTDGGDTMVFHVDTAERSVDAYKTLNLIRGEDLEALVPVRVHISLGNHVLVTWDVEPS